MLVLHRRSGLTEHRHFTEIAGFISPGDALVVNATRVFRARFLGTRESGAPAEILLLKPAPGESRFEAMVHPGGKLHPGRRVRVSDELSVEIEELTQRRTRVVKLISKLPAWEAIEKFGHVPLPPYIERADESSDTTDYQTVFARESGSVAAPTAGLHFSPRILEALRARGVALAEVVLHVGAGTFKPVRSDDPAQHEMHEEWYNISAEAATTINNARAGGGRIVAVGTTVARALESNAALHASITADSGETNLFIRPPCSFRAVDALLTNFHLPRSTLLMLVAAFAGYEQTMAAYSEAIAAGYRFYSYGDAMLIV
jgi:S-adenosylmethionine:tRNA ribosyltransferase-isomerase